MDATTIIGGLTAATVSGLGVSAVARLVPLAWRSHQDLRESSKIPRVLEDLSRKQRIRIERHRKRDTSIIGLYQDLLRHSDGSYTRGYDVPLQQTMLAPDDVADTLIDGFGYADRGHACGHVLQFRYAVAPDPGQAIANIVHVIMIGHISRRSSSHLSIDFFKATDG